MVFSISGAFESRKSNIVMGLVILAYGITYATPGGFNVLDFCPTLYLLFWMTLSLALSCSLKNVYRAEIPTVNHFRDISV